MGRKSKAEKTESAKQAAQAEKRRKAYTSFLGALGLSVVPTLEDVPAAPERGLPAEQRRPVNLDVKAAMAYSNVVATLDEVCGAARVEYTPPAPLGRYDIPGPIRLTLVEETERFRDIITESAREIETRVAALIAESERRIAAVSLWSYATP